MEVFEKITTLDGMIIVGFLLFNLLIGIYFSRGITNIKEYAIGNRNFSTGAIAATIIATWVGGGNYSLNVYETYKNGLYFIVPMLADGLSFFIIAWFYLPRMQEFLGKLSIAEAMGDIYGNKVRMFTAIFCVVFSLGIAAIQFSFLVVVLTNFTEIPSTYIVILCSLVVIIYSILGGIKAVTFTDVIQFFTFCVVIPMTAFCMWRFLGDGSDVLTMLENNPMFDLSQFFDLSSPRLPSTVLLFLFFLIPSIDPALFPRISMARNINQSIKSCIITGVIITLCLYLLFYFMGILLLSDQNATSLGVDDIVPYILKSYLSIGFKGIFVIGIIAICMSTADSYINIATIFVSYDLTQTLNIQIPKKLELLYVRIIALVMGILTIILGLLFQNILDLIIMVYSFYMPTIAVPFILAIFGFRSTSKPVILGMFAGFITVCYIKFFTELDAIALGMLANIVTLTASHYLLRQPGGWVGVKDDGTFVAIQQARKERIQNFFSMVRNFRITNYLTSVAKNQIFTYVCLGFCCIISVLLNLYSLPKKLIEQYDLLLNIIAYTTLSLATILISYPAWEGRFKNRIFISSIAHLEIFIGLIFVSSVFVCINNFGTLQIVIFTISMVITAALLRWKMALLLIISGIIFAGQFYEHYTGLIIKIESFTVGVSLSYVMLMTCTICIIFLKPKEDHLEILEAKSSNLWQKVNDMDKEVRNSNNIKTEFLSNINHEVRTPITGITSLGQALWDNYDNLPDSKRRECVHTIAKNSERLISLMNNILDFSTLTSLQMELHLQKVNISDIVEECIKRCKKLYLEEKELRFDVNIEKKIHVNCDLHHITHTIDNLIINAICYSKPGTIVKITLKQEEGITKFAIRDEGIGIPKEELPIIFRPFTTSSKTQTPAGGRGIGLALCYAAITAHKGRIWAESDGASYAEFKFEI